MDSSDRFQLRPGLYQATSASGEVFVSSWPDGASLGVLGAGLRAALAALAEKSCDLVTLRALLDTDADELDGLHRLLGTLDAGGWLDRTVYLNGRAAYTLCPQRKPAGIVRAGTPEPVLSRFAVLRPVDGELVLESARSPYQLRVHDRELLGSIAALADPASAQSPDRQSLPTRLLDDLDECGFLADKGAEQDELRCAQWTSHELWFHSGSRFVGSGRAGSTGHFGATWWGKDRFDVPPSAREPFGGVPLPLPVPDEQAERSELSAALESRRSLRKQDNSRPLGIDELGEFLYRCARARDNGGTTDRGDRPYPSGGARYELEIYLAVHSVAGLEPGLYHYDPFGHRLSTVHSEHPGIRRMIAVAQRNCEMAEPPQLLIVLAARFGRVMWKYETMAYALILKNVGVLYQTMYLVGTAMGLATCAVGAGDGEAFAAATGLDPVEEANVGEFVLGSRMTAEPSGSRPRSRSGEST